MQLDVEVSPPANALYTLRKKCWIYVDFQHTMRFLYFPHRIEVDNLQQLWSTSIKWFVLESVELQLAGKGNDSHLTITCKMLFCQHNCWSKAWKHASCLRYGLLPGLEFWSSDTGRTESDTYESTVLKNAVVPSNISSHKICPICASVCLLFRAVTAQRFDISTGNLVDIDTHTDTQTWMILYHRLLMQEGKTGS